MLLRRYQEWYRHITLSMAAAAFLLIIIAQPRKRGSSDEPQPRLISFTVNGIVNCSRRHSPQDTIAHTLHWLYWLSFSEHGASL